MLATYRSESESKFSFHSGDVALFHAMGSGFFRGEEPQTGCPDHHLDWHNDAWRSTLERQMDQVEKQTRFRKKPLWYAHAVIVGANDSGVTQFRSDELSHFTTESLLQMSSESGLFVFPVNSDPHLQHPEDRISPDSY